MSLSLVGTLPVGAINVGLAASLPTYTAKIADLQAQLLGFQKAVVLQVQALAMKTMPTPPGPVPVPPNPVLYASAYVLNLAAVVNSLDSLQTFFASQVVGMITALPPVLPDPRVTDLVAARTANQASQLAVGTISTQFSAGLSAGSIAAWNYTGSVRGLAAKFKPVTSWGGVLPTAQVEGLVIITESRASWSAFGEGFATGKSAAVSSPDTSKALLEYMGSLSGGELNTGVLAAKAPLDAYLAELKGTGIVLDYQLQTFSGIQAPDVAAILSLLKQQIALPPIPTLTAMFAAPPIDLALPIASLTAQIASVNANLGSVTAQLSAGGLALYKYSGTASGFGSAISGQLSEGIPGGSGPGAPCYALALACGIPAAWAAFGLIFGG